MSIYPIDKLMSDPGDVYQNAAQILDDPELSAEQKIAILRQWKNEVVQHMVADEENMPGNEENTDLLQQIVSALEFLRRH